MKTKPQSIEKSQLDKALSALAALEVNITTEDRKAAREHFSEFTLIQYLKGRGKNLDTAVKLLEFFKGRITERDKVIAA